MDARIFVDDVITLDCGVWTCDRGVIGVSYRVSLEVTGPIQSNGFIFDFGPLKEFARAELKRSIDHTLIIPERSVSVSAQGSQWQMTDRGGCCWTYEAPRQAVLALPCKHIDLPALQEFIDGKLRTHFPIEDCKIASRLTPFADTMANAFSYTHGIPGHSGLCQRLLHGHRGVIEIRTKDGGRAPDWEQRIAQQVLGQWVHFATPHHIQDGVMEIGKRGESEELVTISYRGSLGEYIATMPQHRVFIVEEETSIECVTYHLARHVKALGGPHAKAEIRCSEGMGKGAIVTI